MGGAGSLTPPPRAWAETSTRAAACGSPSTVKIGEVTGDPSPGKDAQRPAPLCMDTVGGGAQGSKAVAILPLPMQGCKVVSPPTQECKVLCSPLTPPKKNPPKCKHQKTAKRGRPPKPYKATGTPPHLPLPQPPAHLRRLRGGAPGELRGAGGPGAGAGLRLPPCREPRAAPQCSHSACAPPAPLRPAPPRSAPLRSARAAAAPPPPVLWELRARLRPAEMRGGRVPFSPSRQRPLLLAPQQDDQPRADPHLQ